MSALEEENIQGPRKGDFVPPPQMNDGDESPNALPDQEAFWRPPVRFGSIPPEGLPMGWDKRRGFRKLFPLVSLPTQVVERVTFGHQQLEPNRLFWGDNLHVMRQLPSESIDLIYIDPPFFSGRQYNVIFGDKNELRSFSDIWEGGMPGYLIWLNARLYEMKRLLKKSGSIYIHLDWHASHYIKCEMDKIFGADKFRNEVIWDYSFRMMDLPSFFNRKHDAILFYVKSDNTYFKMPTTEWTREDLIKSRKQAIHVDKDGVEWIWMPGGKGHSKNKLRRVDEILAGGKAVSDVWSLGIISSSSKERIGYPTQKPESLLERVIVSSSKEGDVVADFFCGGGTLAAVAQCLNRRWIACDQSRVAVAITADRLTRQVEEQTGKIFQIPDFTVEHWGVYEARRLAQTPPEQFRQFVMRAFGAVPEETQPYIHGMKGAIPVWVGEPDQMKAVTARDVQNFANALRRSIRYQQDNLRDGIMLAWAFRPDALEAADRLRRLEQTDLNFIRLDQIRIDSPRFREHVVALSTKNADYENFLTFVQPPRVEVGHKRLAPRHYIFDVSETVVLNSGAKIINVQWDFDYGKRFSSTPGYSFVRSSSKAPELKAEYEFPTIGVKRIACKVQDDLGGEGMWSGEIEVQ